MLGSRFEAYAEIAIGSHHLEYGFPSTHSTNSISIALYVFMHLNRLHIEGSIYPPTYAISVVALIIYASSIVFGRIYTGMHSFTDCIVGVMLGAGNWALHYFFMVYVDSWVEKGGWIGKPCL